jgi:hypothetical protein
MQYLAFWTWLILLSIMISSSIYFPTNNLVFLYDWIIVHGFIYAYIYIIFSSFMYIYMYVYMYISYILHSFIHCWAPWLILQLHYSEKSCNKHGCAGITLVCSFSFLCIIHAQEWYGKAIGTSIFLVFLNMHLPM